MTKKLQKTNKTNKTLNQNIINILKMVAILSDMVECANKNCSKQKEKIMANNNTATLYNNYNFEKNIDNKLKLAEKYSENDIIYDYNKCRIKSCNKILINLMILFRSIIDTLSITDEKRGELNKMIVELEPLFKKKELTKEEFKMYVKNISILMSNVKQS
jgi:hypothetical protein